MSSVIGGSAFHYSAADTDELPVAGGILHAVTVNTGASSATVDLRDGASGPTLATIDASAPRTFLYDLKIETGLHVVVSGAPDVTIVVLPSPGYTT